MTHDDSSTLLRVLGNSAWLVATEVATRIASFATTLYLARTLARDGVGLVEFGLALFAVLQVVSSASVDVLFTREAARRPAEVRRLAGGALLVAWIQLGVALIVLAVGALVVAPRRNPLATAPLYAMAAAIVPLGLRFAHVAGEQVRILGVAAFLGHVAFLGLCLLLVHAPDQAERVGVCWLAAIGVRSGVQLATFLGRHGTILLDRPELRASLTRTLALGLGSGARGLVLSVDILALGLLAGPEEVARYALAAKVPLFLASFATFFYLALFPTLARAIGAGDLRRVATIQGATLEAVVGVAVPGAVALGLVAAPLVTLLFTEGFRAAGPIFALLVWRLPLLAATGALRTVRWARDPMGDARLSALGLVLVLAGLPFAARAGGVATAAWMLVGDGLLFALYASRAGGPFVATSPSRVGARLGIGVLVAASAYFLPREPALVAVAGALGVWALAILIADRPYVRRLARELGALRALRRRRLE